MHLFIEDKEGETGRGEETGERRGAGRGRGLILLFLFLILLFPPPHSTPPPYKILSFFL